MSTKIGTSASQVGSNSKDTPQYASLTEPFNDFTNYSSKEPFPSPYRALIFLAAAVLVVECFIEILVAKYFTISLTGHILFDSGLMIIMLSPFFYQYLYRSYKNHHEYHNEVQAQIHYLSRQLINASENERKQLSQNLHDVFGQTLTTMQFQVETINNICVEDEAKASGCKAQIKALSQQISDLGDFVRDVSTGLHPHMLEELGLQTTLKYHLEEFEQQFTDIKVTANFTGIEGRLPAEIELAIFRVIQESLNNITKHANARNVVIYINRQKNLLDLSLKDDGNGFDLNELKAMGAKRSGIGLLGMRERIAGLGGRLRIDSNPGQGTSIHAKIPMELRRRKHEAYTGLDC